MVASFSARSACGSYSTRAASASGTLVVATTATCLVVSASTWLRNGHDVLVVRQHDHRVGRTWPRPPPGSARSTGSSTGRPATTRCTPRLVSNRSHTFTDADRDHGGGDRAPRLGGRVEIGHDLGLGAPTAPPRPAPSSRSRGSGAGGLRRCRPRPRRRCRWCARGSSRCRRRRPPRSSRRSRPTCRGTRAGSRPSASRRYMTS